MQVLVDIYQQFQQHINTQPLNSHLKYPQDVYSIAHWVLFWAVVYQMVLRLVAKPLGFIFFPETKGNYLLDRKKLHSAVWKFIYYTTCAVVGFYLLFTEEWVLSPKNYFFGYPNHPMSSAMRLYYNSQMGGYLFAFMLMPFEPAQKTSDYVAMTVHHCATLALLYLSYIWGFFRIGMVIAFLHDLSDPFMEVAKIALYSGRNWLADILFATFAVVFLISRNFIYPYYVILSIPRYGYFEDGSKLPNDEMNFRFQVFLWTLEVLHIYWGSLILKMAYKAITDKGVKDDIRNINHKVKAD